MSLVVLENGFTQDEKILVERCKSNSNVSGYKLRETHYSLGVIAANEYLRTEEHRGDRFSILILMRAGLNFGLGIADMLEKFDRHVDIHFVNDDFLTDEILNAVVGNKVVIVDAVINSGKSLFKVINQLPVDKQQKCLVFTTVIPSSSSALLAELNLFTIRTSCNKYKGGKVTKIQNGIGPDTGDRLFGTL